MKLVLSLLTAVTALSASLPALAQDSSSVVLMRRALDPKTRSHAWVPGDWSQCSNSCGAGQQTRPVQCMLNGSRNSPEVNCTSEKPADTQACYDIQGCSYTWQPGEWTDVAGCGQVVETRELTCLRGDGETVSNDQCPTPAPDTTREVRDLRTCSYEWKTDQWSAFSSECQTAATSTRQVWCERSNGEKVTDAECAGSGAKPAASRTEDRYGQCGYSWTEKAWGAWSSTCQTGATRTRDVVCTRSNGDEVADSFCTTAGAKPETSQQSDQYGSCSYVWRPDAWGSVIPACGNSKKLRDISCVRSNGDVVDASLCDAGTKPVTEEAATDYSTCTYSWNPGTYGPPSSTCGNATSTRAVTCLSSDGRTVGDSFCSGAKPETSKTSYETSGCGYSWQAGAYGAPVPACGPTVQNRSVTCLRSDGQTVGDASCNAATRPASQQGATDYSTCTYGWTATSWGAWSNSCGNATQTRTVTCQSSDGRTVADSFCGAAGAKPEASQSAYQTSGCGYSWQTGGFGAPAAACGATTQTRSVMCLRSDGVTVADASCPAGTRPSATQSATDYSTCGYSWSAGAWGAWSNSCGNATQSRSVTCLRSDGTTVADASCAAGSKPATSQSAYQTSGCGYSWVAGGWSGPNSWCSAAATQTRSIACRRSDGQDVDWSYCGGQAQPATSQTVAEYSGCQPYWYAASGWSDWNSHCSANATRTREIGCFRGENNCTAGTPGYWDDWGNGNCARKLDNSQCVSYPTSTREGFSPANGSETAAIYDGCGYSWQTGGWGAPSPACGASTQYRSVWCRRSDGTTVDDAYCGGGKPAAAQGTTDYSACGYNWGYDGWNTVSQTCGNITQNRNIWCQRSDGAHVDWSLCGGGQPASSQAWADYSACSYSAVNPGAWGGWNSTCSSNAYRSRHYQCRRNDGAIVADAECTNRGIGLDEGQSAAVYDGCSYAVSGWSGWSYASSCSTNTTATQWATGCRRSDGAILDASECSNRGIATSQSTQTSNLTGCGYSWQAGGWSAQQNVCTVGTQYRDIWCQRSDGAWVDWSLCGAGQPATSQNYSNANACGYTAYYGNWGTCANGQQSRSMNLCQRSDGASVAGEECVNRGQPWTQTQSCESRQWVWGWMCQGGTEIGYWDYGGRGVIEYQTKTGVGTDSKEACIAAGGNCYNMTRTGRDGEQGSDTIGETVICSRNATLRDPGWGNEGQQAWIFQ